MSEDQAEAWTYVVPRTIGETDLDFICANSDKERKATAIEKLSHISIDAWTKRRFKGEANAAAWAKLTPEQQLYQLEPDWRQTASTKAFGEWLATAPNWDREATQRNGNQVVDASEAAIVLALQTVAAASGHRSPGRAPLDFSNYPRMREH